MAVPFSPLDPPAAPCIIAARLLPPGSYYSRHSASSVATFPMTVPSFEVALAANPLVCAEVL